MSNEDAYCLEEKLPQFSVREMQETIVVDLLNLSPSELLEMAIIDLEHVEQDPHYIVDMNSWHEARDDQCAVCIAGAVMAMSMNCSPTAEILIPKQFPYEYENCLMFLNFCRLGAIQKALSCLGYEVEAMKYYNNSMTIPLYSVSPIRFKDKMRNLVIEFRSRGL